MFKALPMGFVCPACSLVTPNSLIRCPRCNADLSACAAVQTEPSKFKECEEILAKQAFNADHDSDIAKLEEERAAFLAAKTAKLHHPLDDMIVTTETVVNFEIVERLGVLSAECVLGMGIFKDFFASVRDVVGGRVLSSETALKEAKELVIEQLKKDAYIAGANGVIAVDLDYSEVSGGGKSMLFVVATGTAVKANL